TGGRVGIRKIYSGLDGGKNIIGSMLSFPSERDGVLVIPFTLRNVPGDFRRPYDLAVSISDGRDHQRNIDQAPILVLADGFVVVNALPGLDTAKNRVFLIMPLRRNVNCNVLADDFFGGIAKEPLCGLVPTRNDAL